MDFTSEEKRKIRKAYKTVIKDLELLLKEAKSKDISCSLGRNELLDSVVGFIYCNCFIEVADDYVFFKTRYENLNSTRDRVILATISKSGCLTPYYSNYLLCGAVVKEYPKIRDMIIKEISFNNKAVTTKEQKEQQLKEKILDGLESVQNRYSNSTDILIDLPPSQNQHRLVVKKEDGRNVGTLDFGNTTIRLITDGKIVLVDKTAQDSKVKKK